ncbi:MAG: DUF2892 domain-containing protein [Gemmatimonadota bacterium]
MKCNVGGADRKFRLTLGVLLVVLNLIHILSGTVATIAWIVAAIAILTALLRFCPANSLLGVDTCGDRRSAS